MASSVELNAYALPEDHAIYKLFPGRNYRLAAEVKRLSLVFLDIRGFENLPGKPDEWTDSAVQGVIVSDRIRRAVAEAGRRSVPPASKTLASDKSKLGFFKGLLFTAKVGDLIVVPLGNGLDAEVAIGELTGEPTESVRMVMVEDGQESFLAPARPVRWIGSAKKKDLTVSLIKSLHSSIAWHLIGDSHREQIYRSSYENFVFKDVFVSKFETSKEKFTTSDHAAVAIWFNALAATRDGLAEDESISFFALGLSQLIDADGDMAININSPGTVVLRSYGAFALAAMSLLPLAADGVSVADAKAVTVSVKTVGSASPGCELAIKQTVENYVQALGVNRWKEACEIAQRAAIQATLSTRARLKTGSRKRR